MKGFLPGLLVGLIIGGGFVWLMTKPARPESAAAAAAAPADAGLAEAGGKKGKKRPRGGGGVRGGGGGEGAPIPELSAEDLQLRAQGDALKPRDRSIDMGEGGDDVEPRDLSQGEIDGVFGGAADGIIRCITDARGAAPVTGTISVGVVVGPDGKVVKTRVEAPAYLMKNGLYSCARKRLLALRFPAPGRDTVVTVPFNLD